MGRDEGERWTWGGMEVDMGRDGGGHGKGWRWAWWERMEVDMGRDGGGYGEDGGGYYGEGWRWIWKGMEVDRGGMEVDMGRDGGGYGKGWR